MELTGGNKLVWYKVGNKGRDDALAVSSSSEIATMMDRNV